MLQLYADSEGPDQPAHPRSLIKEALDNVESVESKRPDDTLRMRGVNLNLFILRMLEDTYSLGAAHLIVKT